MLIIYLQYNYIASKLPLNWPKTVLDFAGIIQIFFGNGEGIFSVDCLLQVRCSAMVAPRCTCYWRFSPSTCKALFWNSAPGFCPDMHFEGSSPAMHDRATAVLNPADMASCCCAGTQAPRSLAPQGDGNLPLSIQRTIFNLCVPLVLGFLAAVFWLLWCGQPPSLTLVSVSALPLL